MLDFEKLDRLFEVTYNENKACMFAYVWSKPKESSDVIYKDHIKLSEAFAKVKEKNWHFYPGDETLKTFLVTGILNQELGAHETRSIILYLFNLDRTIPFEDVTDTNGITDTSLLEINRARHGANIMLGLCTASDLVKGFDYDDERGLELFLQVHSQLKDTALSLLKEAFPDKIMQLKNSFINLL